MSQYLKFDTEVYKSLHAHVTKEENDQLIIEAQDPKNSTDGLKKQWPDRIRMDPWILDQSKNILPYLVYFILFITGCVGHNVSD